MPEAERGEHVPVERLAARLEGALCEDEERAVREHLARCAFCDLEAKRIERFSSIESDDGLSRRAEWLYARGKLEEAYKERIAPAFVESPAEESEDRFWRRSLRVLVPAAAAAVILLAVAHFIGRGMREPGVSEWGFMRGALPVSYGITLKAPSGELDRFPGEFSWISARADERYAIEIFAPSLERVYRADGIAGTSFAAPDSLRRILKPNIIYLWSVKGYKGLERTTSSPNGWFRFKP